MQDVASLRHAVISVWPPGKYEQRGENEASDQHDYRYRRITDEGGKQPREPFELEVSHGFLPCARLAT